MDWIYLFTSFDGRISRQWWWLGLIVLTVLLWIVMLLLSFVFGVRMMVWTHPGDREVMFWWMRASAFPMWIAMLIFLYPTLAVYAKRWHDRGKSGWWSLILLVPLIGALWALIECGFLRGTEGPNQYGADPLAP